MLLTVPRTAMLYAWWTPCMPAPFTWRLLCQVAIDGLPVPNSLIFFEHGLHLAKVQGLQL